MSPPTIDSALLALGLMPSEPCLPGGRAVDAAMTALAEVQVTPEHRALVRRRSQMTAPEFRRAVLDLVRRVGRELANEGVNRDGCICITEMEVANG